MKQTPLFAFALAITASCHAAEPSTQLDQLVAEVVTWPGVERFDIGVTRKGTRIPALLMTDEFNLRSKKVRITLVADFADPRPSETTLATLKWFATSPEAAAARERFILSVIPAPYPDHWATNREPPAEAFPPPKDFYQSQSNPEAQYLYRWLRVQAPDLVLSLSSRPLGNAGALVTSLSSDDVLGAIPADNLPNDSGKIIDYLTTREAIDSSNARQELARRGQRSPTDVALGLAEFYGHDLNSVTYIHAVALIGRMQLEAIHNGKVPGPPTTSLAQPYLSDAKTTLPDRASGSHLSGHLYFTELARRHNDPKYLALARRAADLGFDRDGKPRESMPFHNEMSDAVFMGCPLLVQVGALSREAKYHDMALRHFRFMRNHCLRDDGLYRHSPLDETAWGRGNGFPALGIALCLSDLPDDHMAYQPMLKAFREHMEALAKHQDASGMWHQVIDHSGSYREFSCTCMITFAMLRGIRRGWIDRELYGPIVETAWEAINIRIGSDGTLIDVCTGTGKQRSLRDYLDRKAILGRDPRGGAMALLIATEMAQYRRP